MTPLLREAQHVHNLAGLSDRLIAQATGANLSTVRGWLTCRNEPSGARAERLVELSAMTDRLARVVRPEAIRVWLIRPNVALEDQRPIDLIARGDYLRVATVISGIEYPGVS